MRSRTLFQIITAALAVSASALTAPAQVAPITPASSDAQMTAFVGDRLGGLSSGEPTAIRQARMDLLGPLHHAEIDGSFRLQYSGALGQGGLATLATDNDALVAINAIVIAGELATQLSVTILERALGDSREAIRYEAARSMGLLLRAIDTGDAAIPANQVDAIFRSITAKFRDESSVQVIDALVVALGAPEVDPQFRARCVRAMCDGAAGVAQRWRTAQPTEAHALTVFRAIDSAYADLLGVQGGVDKDFARSAAIASGQALSFFVRWVEDTPPSGMDAAERQLAIDLGAASARVLLLAHNTLTGDLQDDQITKPLKDLVEGRPGASISTIRAAIAPWTGPRGRLLTAPYNVKAGAFD
jgi:hypothetical protein